MTKIKIVPSQSLGHLKPTIYSFTITFFQQHYNGAGQMTRTRPRECPGSMREKERSLGLHRVEKAVSEPPSWTFQLQDPHCHEPKPCDQSPGKWSSMQMIKFPHNCSRKSSASSSYSDGLVWLPTFCILSYPPCVDVLFMDSYHPSPRQHLFYCIEYDGNSCKISLLLSLYVFLVHNTMLHATGILCLKFMLGNLVESP